MSKQLDMCEGLHIYTQRTVLLVAGSSSESFCDFLLHEVHGDVRSSWLECVENDRRRDVIRHVARKYERTASDVAKRHFENVALDDLHIVTPSISCAEMRHEITIEFDGNEPARSFYETVSEGSAPRPDLDDSARTDVTQCLDDCIENTRVLEEVLSEALSRTR